MKQSHSLEILNAHRIIWRFCGMWSRQDDSLAYRVYCCGIFILTSVVFNASMVLNLVQHHSKNEVMACLLPATTTILTSLKIAFFLANRCNYIRLFQAIERLETFCDLDSMRAQSVLARAATNCRYLLIVFSITSLSAISFSASIAVFSKDRVLMWPSWYPVDWMGNAKWYYGVLGFQYASNMFLGVAYISLTILGPVLYMILTAHLEILGKRLESIGSTPEEMYANVQSIGKPIDKQANEESLRVCVRWHNLCVRLVYFNRAL